MDYLYKARRFVSELRRRRVVRVMIVYAIVAWILIEVSDVTFPHLGLPTWAVTLVIALAAVGFPVALVLAWAYDLAPGGIVRTPATDPAVAWRSPARALGVDHASDSAVAPRTEDESAPTDRPAPTEGSAPADAPRPPAAPAPKSIAVLPFANFSPDPENEYFSDGMTEELINALTKLRKLKVPARTSVFAFKGRDADVREIGRLLGVCHVLEGSVRKAGNRLRVTVQLIDVSDGYHLWSETYDRELEDVFAIQEEIARSVVEVLRVSLADGDLASLGRRSTESLEAYQLYLKGRYTWNKRVEEGLKASVGYFERAVAVDPGYAPAHAGLADAYTVLGIAEYGFMPPREMMPRAKAAALRALEIDGGLAEAQTSVAHITAFYDWDWEAAEAAFDEAFRMNPDYPFAYHWYACFAAAMRRHEEAIEAERHAQRLEPLSLIINKNVGTILYYSRRYDESVAEYRRSLELEPDFARTNLYLALSLSALEEYDEALEAIGRAIASDPGNTVMEATRGYLLGRAGREEDAREVVRNLRKRSLQRYVPAFNLALVHAGLEEVDETFEWLERAYEERSSWLISLNVEPAFDTVRHDPRLGALMDRIGVA